MSTIVEFNDYRLNVDWFRATLMEWGKTHYRAFPWRSTLDPYQILMAEVMLHRTQARQVQPVFDRFIAHYPDVQTLAQSTREEIHHILQPLGLRWRIDLVYDLAATLQAHFAGNIPRDKTALLSLPGVSEYISGAVRCFAWNEREALMDTNTVRVAGRLFGLPVRESSRRNAQFRRILLSLVDPVCPRLYTFHLLDLAALVCTAKTPQCGVCPLKSGCATGQRCTT